MTLDDLLAVTRSLLRDHASPPLWSDEIIVMYLNEAQERVARLTHSFVIVNRELEIDATDDIYPLDDDVIYVYSVRLDGYPGRLTGSTEGWTPESGNASRPTRYTTDVETQSIRFYSAPDKDYTAILRAAVLPKKLSVDDLDAEIELKTQHQLALPDWAAYRCYTHDDADGRNDMAAEKAKRRFEECLSEVKRDNYRLSTGHGQRANGLRVK